MLLSIRMSEELPEIVIADRRLDPAEVARLTGRPALGNRGMEIEDPHVRDLVREITFSLLGEGDPLP